jgi:hypothetical protein
MYSHLRKYGFSAIGFSFLIGIVILEWGVLLRYFFQVCEHLETSNSNHIHFFVRVYTAKPYGRLTCKAVLTEMMPPFPTSSTN